MKQSKIDVGDRLLIFGVISKYLSFIFIIILNSSIINEASCGAGAQSVNANATGCGFDAHSRKLNIYLNLYFIFFALVLRRILEVSKYLQDSAENGERNVLTLGSLCLPCYNGLTHKQRSEVA